MNWKRYYLILVLPLVIIYLPSIIFAAQAKIQGEYCYQYGDSESLMAAKEISYAMALRKAIETYKTFVASTSIVQDFQLRKDLVETIASGYVENIQIIKQDVKGRKVCTELIGYVNPDAVKSIVARKVETVQKTKTKEFQGLLSNEYIKILNYYKKTYPGLSLYIYILYQAKKYTGGEDTTIIAYCYDNDGNPLPGNKIYVPGYGNPLYKGEVRDTSIKIHGDTVSFELELK